MKLTIGMIVKNEEKWLDKCLSAIKPILDSVDSELIITDTGSTDNTVAIAKKYTDKVLHFDWVNDFSAARNFGLEKAQGEWFMMLDADDIFRSCDSIIEFFNSGEYKNYNAASYVSRNIVKGDNGDTYGDILAPRMVKLHPDTRYENAIHESLNTFDPPYKNLRDIADHYGYYYETDEQKYNKFKRNTDLLLKRLETEKDTTPMLYVQLYEAFSGVGENDKALRFLDDGIAISKRLNSIVLAALYFYKICHLRGEEKYEDAVTVCDEYFGMSKAIRPYPLTTDGEIYGLKAECLYALEKYDDAQDVFEKFFNIFRNIESGKLATYDSYLISGYMCTAVNIMPLFNDFLDSCLKSGKLNTADSRLVSYPMHRYAFEQKYVYELVQYELSVSEHLSYRNTAKYYECLDPAGKKIMVDELFGRLEEGSERQAVSEALDRIAKNDVRISEKYDIYRKYLSHDDVFVQICDYINKYGISQDIDLIFILFRCRKDVGPALIAHDIDVKQCAYLCCKNINGFYDAAENYYAGLVSDANALPAIVKFYDYCISIRLMENEDKSDDEKKQLIEKLYGVKSALNERYKREVTSRNSAMSQFELLAAQVKRNIRSLISSGDLVSARKALEEYKTINPEDEEIPKLSQKIDR